MDRLLVDPFSRRPSEDLLRRLREIDPRAEVLAVRDSTWTLGAMRPGTERTLKARELAARMLDKFGWIPEPTRRWIYVVAQGFAAITQYPRNVADGVMVEDFRRRDYNYRVRREEVFRQAEAESDGSLDEERWRAEALDLAQSVALDAWDYGAKVGSGKGRPTVTVKEVPWSQSSAH